MKRLKKDNVERIVTTEEDAKILIQTGFELLNDPKANNKKERPEKKPLSNKEKINGD